MPFEIYLSKNRLDIDNLHILKANMFIDYNSVCKHKVLTFNATISCFVLWASSEDGWVKVYTVARYLGFCRKCPLMHGYTNPFLQLGSVHHSWALLRAGGSHLFLHIADNPLGWGEAKKAYSFWATPTSARRFPPLGKRAILDPLTRRSQTPGLLQCKKFIWLVPDLL